MKARKKLLALFLALCMTASLAACGGGSDTSSGTESGGSETSEAASQGETGSGEETSGETKTLSIFVNHTWWPVENFEGIVPEAMTEATGVVLDPTIAVDGNQLGVMIASGELPDIVWTQTLLDRMSDPGVSYSYEELIEEYGVDWELTAEQLQIARGYAADGKAYTVLDHLDSMDAWEETNAVPMVGAMTMRKDIYEALGSPALESLDDMYNVMGMVKEQYPDMVPLKLNENWNTEVFRDLVGMGAPKYIEQEDGSYVHYTMDPRYKDMMLWLNKCYRAGYIVPDDPFFVTGSTAIPDDQYFFGCSCTQNGITSLNATLAAIDPSYQFCEMVPFEESSFTTSDLGWSGAFISKNCEDPETAIKFIAWTFSPEGQALTQMGREGIDYTLDENGLPQFSEEWTEAVNNGTHSEVFNAEWSIGRSEIIEAETRCATLDQELVGEADAVIKEKFDNYPWVEAARPVGESDEKIIEDKITETVLTYEQKIILAETEEAAEATYQEYVDICDQTGLDKVEQYVTEKIKETKPLYGG